VIAHRKHGSPARSVRTGLSCIVEFIWAPEPDTRHPRVQVRPSAASTIGSAQRGTSLAGST
jgi:hypothetical protein